MSATEPTSPAAPPGPPKPLIDDRFWFERSTELVSGGSKARIEAGDKFQAAVAWFWTVYSAAAIVGVALADKTFPFWAALVLVAPVAALVAAYWAAGFVRVPESVEFDPRSPTEIEYVYKESARKQRNRLLAAVVLSAVAAVLVVAAILVASLVDDDDDSDGTWGAAVHGAADNREVIVGGDFPAGTKVVITVTPTDPAGAAVKDPSIVPASGELDRRIAVTPAKKYDVTVEWTEEKVGVHTLTKAIAP